MSKPQTDAEPRTDLPRRQVLGYLGAAVGGALLGGNLSKGETSTRTREAETPQPEVIKVNAEQAMAIKEQSAAFAKKVFAREGYTGKRQSDMLTATQWNPSTGLSIEVLFRSGGERDVLVFDANDIDSVRIRYGTENEEVGTGEGDTTEGTVPLDYMNGAGKNSFDVTLFEVESEKRPPSQPGMPLTAHELPEEPEFLLEVRRMDLNPTDLTTGTPLKPMPPQELIMAAFAQFE